MIIRAVFFIFNSLSFLRVANYLFRFTAKYFGQRMALIYFRMK